MCVPSAKERGRWSGLVRDAPAGCHRHFRCNKTSSLDGRAVAGVDRGRGAMLPPGAGRADADGEPVSDDATAAELGGAITWGSGGAAVMGGGAGVGGAGSLAGTTRTAGAPSSVLLGGAD